MAAPPVVRCRTRGRRPPHRDRRRRALAAAALVPATAAAATEPHQLPARPAHAVADLGRDELVPVRARRPAGVDPPLPAGRAGRSRARGSPRASPPCRPPTASRPAAARRAVGLGQQGRPGRPGADRARRRAASPSWPRSTATPTSWWSPRGTRPAPASPAGRRGRSRRGGSPAGPRWSAGAPVDPIRVDHLVDNAGEPVPHLGTRWIGSGVRWRVTYAPGATGSPDGGVGRAAAGDLGVAAITTWSRQPVRAPPGSAPCRSAGSRPPRTRSPRWRYPEAFPVSLRRDAGGPRPVRRGPRATSASSAARRATYLRSPGFRAILRGQGRGLVASG